MRPTRSSATPPLAQASETFALVDGALRIAVVADIDARATHLPDVVNIAVRGEAGARLGLLLTHVAVDRTRVRADVGRLARASGAGLVVCGHSHVPFAAHDRGLTVFNPGSVGPRRFHLPIVFGVIEVRAAAQGEVSRARRPPDRPP